MFKFRPKVVDTFFEPLSALRTLKPNQRERELRQLKTSFTVFYKVFSELCVRFVFVSLVPFVVQKSVHHISKHAYFSI